jgi:hypothetical protein
MTGLTKEQTQSLKKSYLNIVGLFLNDEKIESRYLRCLLKWGFQLHLHREDLKAANVDLSHLKFSDPDDKAEKVEAMYHLVYMISLDKVVEDVELEVASLYAERLGFKNSLVCELLNSIVTADSDGNAQGDVRQQVLDFLRLNEA